MRIRKIFRLTRPPRGSATVMALMVTLLLLIVVVAAMTLSMADSEMVQDYARNKKSFQAADSGVAHSEVRLAHALSSWSIPPSTTPEDVTAYGSDAESQVTEGNRDISLLENTALYLEEVIPQDMPRGYETTYGSTEYSTGGLYVSYAAGVDITPTGVTYPDPGDISHQHTFHYAYTIDSRGEATQNAQHHKASREQRGTFDVEVKRPSFASYGYFTNSMKNQFDDQLVFFDGEVYDGPTHVNSAPPEGRAGFYGQPTFNGPFTAVQELYEDSWLGGGANPIFNDSVTWGVDEIPTPENGWSQLRAAIGDYANVEDPTLPSNVELRSLLGIPTSADPVDEGVYFSGNYNESLDLMGGIFINGDADNIEFDVSGDSQVIRITMTPDDGGHFSTGNPRVWEFVTDPSGSTSVTLDGVSEGVFNEPLNGMIHIEGDVNGLGGDGDANAPDIASDMGMTVSATGEIYINDHITYEVDPRDDPDAENILGIFSSNSNIYLAQEAPSNLELHATVMAVGEDCGVGTEGLISGSTYNYNYPNKGDWNLLGGLIEDKNQTTGVYYSNGHTTGYRWNFDYDDRFSSGVAPPFFPYVTRFIIEMKNKETQSWGRQYY